MSHSVEGLLAVVVPETSDFGKEAFIRVADGGYNVIGPIIGA